MDKFVLMYHGFGNESPRYSLSLKNLERDVLTLKRKGYSFSRFSEFNKSIKKEVCLTFDDGFVSNYEASKVLDKFQIKATFFVISDKINQEGYLSEEQIKDMASKGHEFGSHTCSHVALTSLKSQKLKEELVMSKEKIGRIVGKRVTSVSIPGGAYNRETILECLKFYQRVRTSDIDYVTDFENRVYPAVPVIKGVPRKIYLSEKGVSMMKFFKQIRGLEPLNKSRGNAVLHLHTDYSDGRQTLSELKTWLISQGIRVAFVSDHSDRFDKSKFDKYVAECKELSDNKFVFVICLEVATKEDYHILHLNPKSLPVSNLSIGSTIARAKRDGTEIIIAHVPPRAYFVEGLRNLEVFNAKQSSSTGWARFMNLGRMKRANPHARFFGGSDLHFMKKSRLVTFDLKFSINPDNMVEQLSEDHTFRSRHFGVDSEGNLFGNKIYVTWSLLSNFLFRKIKIRLRKVKILRRIREKVRW